MKKVGICVLNYNGRQFVDQLYPTLLSQSYQDFEIYAIDNASTDDSLQLIRNLYPSVHILKLKRNYGFARAFNYAARVIPHPYLVFLNNDTKVAPEWLAELVAAIERHPHIIVVNSKALIWDRPDTIDSAGGKFTFMGGGFNIGLFERDGPEFSTPGYIGAAVGSSMLVRRESFLHIGGFDPDYFMYIEETDFCWRAWLAGFRIYFSPRSMIFHKQSYSSGRKSTIFKEFHLIKNRNLTVLKNTTGFLRLSCLFISLCYDWLLIVLQANYNKMLGWFKAWKYLLRHCYFSMKRTALYRKDPVHSTFSLMRHDFFANISESIQRMFIKRPYSN
jgi:GT2 family glycosyltransferase